MLLSSLGFLATPLDLLLASFERRLYRTAEPPQMPMLFVCGAPRTGTTVVAQTIAHSLPVAYFTNLTSVFPRAPLTAGRLLRVAPDPEAVTQRSHYGRSAGFRGPNDALYLWDRWLGPDRTAVTKSLSPDAARRMVQFFGAHEALARRPLVSKNNALNAHASLVGEHLPTARFLCLDRDPVYLAQSLLIAREYIHGDAAVSYGVDVAGDRETDPVADVCRQVRFHRELAREQLSTLGPERFVILPYEDFCAAPAAVVREAAQWLGVPADPERLPGPLTVSRSRRLPPAVFERLQNELSG